MNLQGASPLRTVVWDAERSVNPIDIPDVECQSTGIRSKANFEIKEPTGKGRLMVPHEQTCSPVGIVQ